MAGFFKSVFNGVVSKTGEFSAHLFAPEDVKVLRKIVNEVKRGLPDGEIDPRGGSDIGDGGGGGVPNISNRLRDAAIFTEEKSDNLSVYQEHIGLIIDALRVLTAYSLNYDKEQKHDVRAYGDAADMASALCKTLMEEAQYIVEGSELEQAICTQFSESFMAAYDRKVQDGEGMQYKYLSKSLLHYGYDNYDWYTSKLKETMGETFKAVYSDMEAQEKKEALDVLQHDFRGYYSLYLEGLLDEIEGKVSQDMEGNSPGADSLSV